MQIEITVKKLFIFILQKLNIGMSKRLTQWHTVKNCKYKKCPPWEDNKKENK
jgi:hypothetical protein